MIDPELNGLAVLVIKNALYEKMREVMTAHFYALRGITFSPSELYDVHAFESSLDTLYFDKVDIRAEVNKGVTCGFDTIKGALEYPHGVAIHVEGKKVFERRQGEWFYVGDET